MLLLAVSGDGLRTLVLEVAVPARVPHDAEVVAQVPQDVEAANLNAVCEILPQQKDSNFLSEKTCISDGFAYPVHDELVAEQALQVLVVVAHVLRLRLLLLLHKFVFEITDRMRNAAALLLLAIEIGAVRLRLKRNVS